jgi:hypothetical protein
LRSKAALRAQRLSKAIIKQLPFSYGIKKAFVASRSCKTIVEPVSTPDLNLIKQGEQESTAIGSALSEFADRKTALAAAVSLKRWL